jgi:hypothetical protein
MEAQPLTIWFLLVTAFSQASVYQPLLSQGQAQPMPLLTYFSNGGASTN